MTLLARLILSGHTLRGGTNTNHLPYKWQFEATQIASGLWDIFTLFTFETWLFDEQSSFDIIVLLLRISCIDEELNSWKRFSLQKQRHIVDIWCMRWTAPILFQFLFPQLFASDSRGDVTGAILSRRLFRTFLLRMEFLDSGSFHHHHHHLRRISVETGMMTMKRVVGHHRRRFPICFSASRSTFCLGDHPDV